MSEKGSGSYVSAERGQAKTTVTSRSDAYLRGFFVAPLFDRDAAFLDAVAGDGAALDRQRLRPFDLATFVGERAARMEGAAAGRIDRARHLAADRRALAASHLEVGDRVEQHPSVRMLGPAEQCLGRRLLDDAAEVHHADARRDVIDH